jgi:hypothetical protein
MATPSSIGGSSASRLPIGILGALGIKTLGRYPQQLSDTYQSVFDVLDFIHASNYASSRVTGINWDLATVGNNLHAAGSGFIVPDNEVWYVPARGYAVAWASLTASFASTLYYVMSGGVTNDPGARFVSTCDFFAFATWTANGRPTQSNDQPFFLPPGSQLGWRNALGAVGPAAVGGFTLQALRMTA